MSYDISIDYREGDGAYRVPLKEHPVERFSCLKVAYMCIPYSFELAFVHVFGYGGVHVLDGMSVKDSIPAIDSALERVGSGWDFDDPWIPSGESVKAVLNDFRALGEQVLKEHPGEDVMWTVDWLDRQERNEDIGKYR